MNAVLLFFFSFFRNSFPLVFFLFSEVFSFFSAEKKEKSSVGSEGFGPSHAGVFSAYLRRDSQPGACRATKLRHDPLRLIIEEEIKEGLPIMAAWPSSALAKRFEQEAQYAEQVGDEKDDSCHQKDDAGDEPCYDRFFHTEFIESGNRDSHQITAVDNH